MWEIVFTVPSETEMGTIVKESFAENLIEQVPPCLDLSCFDFFSMESLIPITSSLQRSEILASFTNNDVTVIAKLALSVFTCGTFPINVHPRWVLTATKLEDKFSFACHKPANP
ncbi:hypothetical protein AVEN_261428-1 [Araneus ventricosus]|uniref:Uncharacterized protein n=1 Tax=Araneus ventricosus TaxID=182803 RepID=A0A4Y2GX45_ARAVE|nr:hypothetical protein AVEN_261428-1 [Araneus ventricosus]